MHGVRFNIEALYIDILSSYLMRFIVNWFPLGLEGGKWDVYSNKFIAPIEISKIVLKFKFIRLLLVHRASLSTLVYLQNVSFCTEFVVYLRGRVQVTTHPAHDFVHLELLCVDRGVVLRQDNGG